MTPTALVAQGEPPLQITEVSFEADNAADDCAVRVFKGGRLLAENERKATEDK